MTVGKASALIVALAAAVAFGVWIGPYLTDRNDEATPTSSIETAAPAPVPAAAESSSKPRAPRANQSNPATRAASADTPAVKLSESELEERLKPILNRGADISLASAGFRDAEQFATVAHAARSTNIPFMLLKHRVLNEGKTLAAAIHESRPEVDAAAKVKMAQESARRTLKSPVG